jgi:hypothetical protein
MQFDVFVSHHLRELSRLSSIHHPLHDLVPSFPWGLAARRLLVWSVTFFSQAFLDVFVSKALCSLSRLSVGHDGLDYLFSSTR